jgi:hypothetical protein
LIFPSEPEEIYTKAQESPSKTDEANTKALIFPSEPEETNTKAKDINTKVYIFPILSC